MNLNPIKANMTELDLGNGTVVLFSYKTPVACRHSDGMTYRTDKKWSVTTSRHINTWLASCGVLGSEFKPQEFFDGLVK